MQNGNGNKPYIEQDRIAIEVGINLQLQVGHLATRMESTLVGIRPGRYLIISMPKGPNVGAARLNEEGTPLVIRYIHHGNAYGFVSAVLHTTSAPERLLFVSHPVQVEVFELRNYPRVPCFLPARATIDGQVYYGSVVDLSRTGARFAFTGNAATSTFVERIDTPTQLEVQFPGAAGYTHIVGTLRDVHAHSDKVNLGIRFDDVAGPQLANLLSFLLDAQALPEHHGLSAILRKHIAWKKSVSEFINGPADQKPDYALSPNDCDLGRWLNTTGKEKYGKTAEFAELNETHRLLHEQVESITRQQQQGDQQGAREQYNRIDIEHLSHRIAALLISADEHRKDTASAPPAPAAPAERPLAAATPEGMEELPATAPAQGTESAE